MIAARDQRAAAGVGSGGAEASGVSSRRARTECCGRRTDERHRRRRRARDHGRRDGAQPDQGGLGGRRVRHRGGSAKRSWAAGLAVADSAAAVAERAPTIVMSLPSAAAAHAVARELAGANEDASSSRRARWLWRTRRRSGTSSRRRAIWRSMRRCRARARRRRPAISSSSQAAIPPRSPRSCRCSPASRARRTISAPSATAAA